MANFVYDLAANVRVIDASDVVLSSVTGEESSVE